MTLLDLCEPYFQYLCLLNRSASAGSQPDYFQVRDRIKDLVLSELPRAAEQDNRLSRLYAGPVQDALVYMADYVISAGTLSFARQWSDQRLANELHKMAGDEAFFDLVEKDLGDPSEDAMERLSVYYVCLGLGFAGMYQGDEAGLSKVVSRVAARINTRYLRAEKQLCPQAYSAVDMSNLTKRPARTVLFIVVLLVGSMVALFVSNIVLFRMASADLTQALETINALNTTALSLSGSPGTVVPSSTTGGPQK